MYASRIHRNVDMATPNTAYSDDSNQWNKKRQGGEVVRKDSTGTGLTLGSATLFVEVQIFGTS